MRLGAIVACALLCGCALYGCRAEPEGGGSRAVAGRERAPRGEVSLLFLGDINMGRTLGRRIKAGETDYPLARIKELVSAADFACADLEVQVSDLPGTVGEPNSLRYCAPAVVARMMVDAGFDAVCSANNHMWDYGKDALVDTIANLDKAGLPHTGIGATRDEAYAPVIAEVGGWRIALFSATSIFNYEYRGDVTQMLAWADLARMSEEIAEVRDSVDVVIVNHHGGDEYAGLPSEEVKAFDRGCLAAGADMVWGGHPHVFEGGEWWEGKAIFYSVGNLVFRQGKPHTDEGLGVRMILREGSLPAYELVGLHVDYQPSVLTDTSRYRERFQALSKGFAQPMVWEADGSVGGP